MSTKTDRRPKKTAKHDDAANLPEWRRLCHRYNEDSQKSICGVGVRTPGEDHYEEECKARGHTVCVVCEALLEKQTRTQ